MKKEYGELRWRVLVRGLERRAERNRRAGGRKIYGFLDFDGVINVFHQPGSPEYERLLQQDPEHFNFADPGCVRRVSDLCVDYGIDIVISSSWRYAGLEYCRSYLKDAGMSDRVRFAGVTDDAVSGSREKKIVDYLRAHDDYIQFLVFDDIYMKHLRRHLLHCDCTQGYTEELDEQARRILGGPESYGGKSIFW